MAWTLEAEEFVWARWGLGDSASSIARQLKERFEMDTTRNAVIGKVHRLKGKARRRSLPEGQFPGTGALKERKRGRKPLPVKVKAVPKVKRKPKPKPITNEVAEALLQAKVSVKGIETEPVSEQGKFIMDLEQDECRFGIGQRNGKHVFCGQPTGPKRSYCDEHHRRCYPEQPPKKKEAPAARYAGRRLVAVH